MPDKITQLEKDFRDKVINGKCQSMYVVGIPEIEMLFAEINRLRDSVIEAKVAKILEE